MYYIIIAALFIIIAALFSSTIFTVISFISVGVNNNFSIGTKWFLGLLIINITLIIFTYTFYYYKLNYEGIKGLTGQKGFDGQSGDGCVMPISNGISTESICKN